LTIHVGINFFENLVELLSRKLLSSALKIHKFSKKSTKQNYQFHLETVADVVDGDVSLLVLVNEAEALDIHLHLGLAQVDGNLVLAGPVHVLAHLELQEVERRLKLRLLLGAAPLELLAHDVDDQRQRFLRRLHIEEGKSQPASDHVDGGAGVLLDGVAHLRVDVGELGVQTLANDGPPLTGHRRQPCYGEGAVAIRVGQVLGNLKLGLHFFYETTFYFI
jgi:hypothetical protein